MGKGLYGGVRDPYQNTTRKLLGSTYKGRESYIYISSENNVQLKRNKASTSANKAILAVDNKQVDNKQHTPKPTTPSSCGFYPTASYIAVPCSIQWTNW